MTEAYFISPKGYYVIPIFHGTHIAEVIASPRVFSLTIEGIAEVYKRHMETMPKEGFARDEILTELLKKGWIRARIKGGYMYCQVGFLNKRIYKNILKLVLGKKSRSLGLRVYIVSESWIIDAYDAPEAIKQLYERIR